ncbi:hypothetical protein JHE06_07900 [Carnobacterium sp. CS13]|uniref:DUF1796 family putative cysteine peptidase n=1 Tax=Carnobacterium sp. CS13 TaxID=2800128 RepID=UPI001911871D|nr:DUF1796 family putative cysteine peptidase [Carnobacterium sp. CS13]QQP69538.1 hypothetical protein JHE06_07900 [Carnobacterium sp. CS13]
MENYQHFISLGFFCSTASELEKIGLRDTSSPFDWLITDLKGIIQCIENRFEGLLDYENLSQYRDNPNYYVNEKYGVHFYHDFSGYSSLKEQLPNVFKKYKRRIEKFYINIKEPTLFFRYIKDNNELKYIENNYKEIISVIKKHNQYNDLILISNDDIASSSLYIYKVKKDENDTVARNFLSKNRNLKNYLCSDIYNKEKRNINLKKYKEKYKYIKLKKLYNRLYFKIKSKVTKHYIHKALYIKE